MEDTANPSGFENLKDGAKYRNLYASALCRSKAGTGRRHQRHPPVFLMYHRTNVGRVVSPRTLVLLVQREAEISAFQPELF